MVTPAVRRTAVAHLAEAYEMSERRACRVIAADRSSVRYRAERPDDARVRERLRGLAAERRRFGYRRLHVLLRKEGLVVNRKRTQRLYRETPVYTLADERGPDHEKEFLVELAVGGRVLGRGTGRSKKLAEQAAAMEALAALDQSEPPR